MGGTALARQVRTSWVAEQVRPFPSAPGPRPLPRNLASLTSLRAFAALLVFLFHLDMFGILRLPGASLGYSGVGFFFILSGFVLTWGTRPDLDVRIFMRRRFARVYPSHLAVLVVVLVLALVVVGSGPSPLAIGTSLLLVQAWWPSQEIAYGLNGAAWSLSCEAAFYASFPLLLRGLRALSPRVRLLVPVAWLAVTVAIAIAEPAANRLLYHFPLARMGEFVLGIVAALAIQAGWRPRWRLAHALAFLGMVTLVLSVTVPETTIVGASLAVPFVALIVAASMSDVVGCSRVLRTRALVYAGEVSFTFYLVHQLLLSDIATRGLPGPVGAVAGFVASAVCAVILHHAVERPMQRLLSRPRRADGVPGGRPV